MPNFKKDVQELLGSGGPLEIHLEGYLPRQEQQRFAAAVANAFENETFLLAEAGTGVGKTYAYLLPAILWARLKQEKVVLATKTKALQEQIVDRDLPQLERALGHKIRSCEAKGRDNYLCWNKYHNIKAGKTRLEPDQIPFLEAILGWAESTKSGDRKEIGIKQELMQHWEIVAADRHACQREMCKHQERCFRMKMLKSLAKADLIVTNHALLLTDLMLGNSILPEYKCLIIDEAHNFNKESFERLALKLSHFDFLHLMQRLIVRDKRSRRGFLPHLASSYPHLSELLDEITALVGNTIKCTGELFALLQTRLSKEEMGSVAVLGQDDLESKWFQQTLQKYQDEWKPLVELLMSKIRALSAAVEGNEDSQEVMGIGEALREMDDTAFTIFMEKIGAETSLSWLESIQGHAAVLCCADLDSDRLLEKSMYQRLNTLVMVSATLTVEERFDNIIERCGLGDYARQGKIETLLEYSPFDYQKQAGLYLVKDLSEPTSPDFTRSANAVLGEIFFAQGGQTMVLFTSRKQLEESAKSLRPLCTDAGLRLLVQHEDGEFANLIEDFASHPNSILMGLETFWEGIDLKGDILKCLVIVRLPFRSPADPYCSAWDQHYKRRGINSFAHFMLPDAALRFKQGVGRLIRSETDRGVVVVLDTRLISRGYGRVFRNSIPIQEIKAISQVELATILQSWAAN